MLAAMPLLMCTGCQQKFTRQRYETIRVTMPEWEVREVLGSPKRRDGEVWTYVNERPYYRAEITFAGGEVVGKDWSVDRPATGGE